LKIRLSERAERQLAELPRPAAVRVVKALRALADAPRSGQSYPADSEFRDLFYKLVVVRSRRWAYRITYAITDDNIFVYYVFPSWYPATHPDR
jgi:mRNA-degrading endonuclease RelE of RelBE toxin-antitoxin system